MRIAVMGAGALGGYIGARLAEAGEDVAFIGRGAHLASMRANGLRILSPVGDLHLSEVTATAEPAAIGPVDLVLFTVKLWDAKPAAAALTPLIGPQTRVVGREEPEGIVAQGARPHPDHCLNDNREHSCLQPEEQALH